MRYKQRHFSPGGYHPRVYGYGRVSHKRQFDAGNSLEAQESRIKAYYDLRKLDEESGLKKTEWKGFFAEPRAQSAFCRPFRNRPTGSILMYRLQPEDHLIIDKLDRMWRDQEDFNSMLRHFAEHGITLHFVNFFGLSLDGNTTGGKIMLSFAAMMAEAESMQISDRVKKARQQMRDNKKHCGVKVPMFCKLIDMPAGKERGSGGRLIFKPNCIELMKKIKAAHDSGEHTQDIGVKNETVCNQMDMIFGKDKFTSRRHRVAHLLHFYEAWTEAGEPDINTLKIGEFITEYRAKKKIK